MTAEELAAEAQRVKTAVLALHQHLLAEQNEGGFLPAYPLPQDFDSRLLLDIALLIDRLRTHGEAEHARGYAAGQEAMRERASEGAAGFSTQQHVAHSIKYGVFPEQTDIREAIAAAIRVLSIEPTPAERAVWFVPGVKPYHGMKKPAAPPEQP